MTTDSKISLFKLKIIHKYNFWYNKPENMPRLQENSEVSLPLEVKSTPLKCYHLENIF